MCVCVYACVYACVYERCLYVGVCVRVRVHLCVCARVRALAAHADVAGLAAGVLLGVDGGQAHELVAADLGQRAQAQVHGLGEDHLQDHVLRVLELQPPVLAPAARQEAVVGQVQRGQPLLAEAVAGRAPGRQHQDDVVVGRVHAVEVPEVEAGVGVQQRLGRQLEAEAAVRGVLRRLARVELGVAAEEDALQLAADGGAVAAAVVLDRRSMRLPSDSLGREGGREGEERDTERQREREKERE